MKTLKSGVRVLGIAESFVQGAKNSVLAGVVMRRDLIIDGAAFGYSTIGGMDATGAVLDIVNYLERQDINFIMLSGCVISWFNIIDPGKLYNETDIPVIVVTYEDSEGLADDICHHFPNDDERLAAYEILGTRSRYFLKTGYDVYLRSWGMDMDDAFNVCNIFTKSGRIPEPLKTARILARAAMRSFVQ
ncbi:MAG: DUF99 family protein [Methanomicrobiaceae archaeon]|nr:DUF99 family protein [Methanomicrobiaceae archaeon]